MQCMASQPLPATPTSSTAAERRAKKLVDDLAAISLALLADGAGIGDLKIAAATLHEMREAFRIFAAHNTSPKVTIFGSARTQPREATYLVAESFARAIADAGFMVITGAGPGIMEASQRGAGRERSFGVNIQLPFEQQANSVIDGDPKLLGFKYFFTRKLFFLKEADAVVLFPGGFGTLDEGFEILTLLQTGKCQPIPVVMLDAPHGTYWKTWQRYVEDHLLRRSLISTDDLSLYKIAPNVDEAVAEILRYYRVFHSVRYVRDLLVVRLRRAIPPEFVSALAAEFADVIEGGGGIVQRAAFAVEQDEPEIAALPRLALRFNRVAFGRLRQLIDKINDTPA
jgi:uncharacterized protein (TIGR00730 family)